MKRTFSVDRKRTDILSLLLVLLVLASQHVASAQVGYVRVKGKARSSNAPLNGVTINVSSAGGQTQIILTQENGTYDFNLALQKNFTLSFVKPGMVTKVIEFNTTVPGDQTDIIFEKIFDMDLFTDQGGISQNNSMNKPVARFAYDPNVEDFEFDANYSKQVKAEQLEARRAIEEQEKLREKSRLDSLNRLWTDSLAKSKDWEAKLAVIRAEQEKARRDSLAKAQEQAKLQAAAAAREKARQDSLAKAQAEALRQQEIAEQREKNRRDSLARAERERVRLDSLAAVKAAAEAAAKAAETARLQQKARQDSIQAAAKAEQDRKLQEAAEKQRLALLEKQRQDSLSKAEAAFKIRQKQIADSTEKANAALARQQAEEQKKQEELAKAREKARQDSLANAALLQKQREQEEKLRAQAAVDSSRKAQADLAARQAEEKKQQEAAARAREKAQQDSLLAANERAAREKAQADAAEKARLEKLAAEAAAAKALLAETNRQAEQNRKDSLAAAERQRLAMIAEKNRKDSVDKAEAAAKAQADADEKARQEELRKQRLAQEKATQDSLTQLAKEAAEKEEAERQARAYAEIQARKEMQAKSAQVKTETKAAPAAGKASAAAPKIKDSDYQEGITEETITESNRSIKRVVIKVDGKADDYQKVVYNWGGIFYFKNEMSITQTTFEQDIKNARATLKK
ncbi:MAG: hypothetical protein RL213_59 [Bacteroidota bacterium]|jgi:hypothetical protein